MRQSLLNILCIAMTLLYSCQSSSESAANEDTNEAEEIYLEAMAIHDEVMPRMDEIMRLKSQLNERIDSLQNASNMLPEDVLQQLHSTVENLDHADQAMMQWMRNVKKVPTAEDEVAEYPADIETTSLEVTTNMIQIQQEQKAAIAQVKVQMEEVIEEANQLLQSQSVEQ